MEPSYKSKKTEMPANVASTWQIQDSALQPCNIKHVVSVTRKLQPTFLLLVFLKRSALAVYLKKSAAVSIWHRTRTKKRNKLTALHIVGGNSTKRN